MILVTGATGFLGRNLCEHLAGRGHSVRAMARPQSGHAFLKELGVEVAYWQGVNDSAATEEAMNGCESVIHAAAKFRFWGRPEDFERINVEGTRNVLEAACRTGVRRFIYVSTVAVVGQPLPGHIIDEGHSCRPLDDYQRTKLAAERMSLRYHAERDLSVVVVRPGALYGPWGHYAFNRLFFEDFLKGLRVQVHRGRHITFPAYVKDVAAGIEASLERGRLGDIYNLSGQSISHRQANLVVSRLAGKSAWRLNAPKVLMVGLAAFLTFLADHVIHREPWYPLNLYPYVFYDWPVSSEKAERELGFRARSFVDGAQETLEWYYSQSPSS